MLFRLFVLAAIACMPIASTTAATPEPPRDPALHAIFDAYSDDLQKARDLTPTGTFPVLLPSTVAAHSQAAAR